MSTIFVYEYCCAIGATGSLGREGRAMRDAVADDFRQLPDTTVLTLDAAGFADASVRFAAMVRQSDAVLVIVPESETAGWERLALVERSGRPMLNPGLEAFEQCQCKQFLAGRWHAAGVPTPATWKLADWPMTRFPAVSKPRDGCGSEAINLISNEVEAHNLRTGGVSDRHPDELIVQDFIPGRAASVAFLIGPGQIVPLLPTFQKLSDDGRFQYLGGEIPIPPALAARAVALGHRAVTCVPGLRGYVGVDLVLGEAADGSDDSVIEINPRLTTSYVGLRTLAETNLAGAMLDVCAGRSVIIRWKAGHVRFSPDGTVNYDPTPGTVAG